MNIRDLILTVILTFVAIGQIVLTILLYSDHANDIVRNTGWGILWLSAVFGWLPILTLKRWGNVPKKKSYINTTQLVDRGVYSIVRHPQYLAGVLMGIALPLIAQHWIVGILGVVVIIIYYVNTFDEEKRVIDKFGDEYLEYTQEVPRLNFLRGIVRAIRNRASI